MGRFRFGAAVLLLAMAAACPAASAAALTNEDLAVSGLVTYTWHGETGRGCGRVGVCGVKGAVIVHIDSYAQYLPRFSLLDTYVDGAIARSRLDQAETRPTECIDRVDTGISGQLQLGPIAHGGTRARWYGWAPSSGRCAGPLVQELGSIPIAARISGGRLKTFDFRGSRRFAAGPFSGELISTLVMRPDTSGSGSFVLAGGSSQGRVVPTTTLLEFATLLYRVNSGPGTLHASFVGQRDPLCQPTDACGVKGSLGLSLAPRLGTIKLTFDRVVRGRVRAARAIADLRHGLLALDPSLPNQLFADTGIRESVTRPEGAGCSDAVTGARVLLTFGSFAQPGKEPLEVSLGSPFVLPSLPDPFRTHCQGPAESDLTSGESVIARGAIATQDLGRRSTELTIVPPGPFRGLGYFGTQSGGLQLRLTLIAAHAGTRGAGR